MSKPQSSESQFYSVVNGKLMRATATARIEVTPVEAAKLLNELTRRLREERDIQSGKTCEPFEDPRAHDFQGWVEFDEGRGGTQVCTRCGISAFSHSMRYAP